MFSSVSEGWLLEVLSSKHLVDVYLPKGTRSPPHVGESSFLRKSRPDASSDG